jgi:hypothetical protein
MAVYKSNKEKVRDYINGVIRELVIKDNGTARVDYNLFINCMIRDLKINRNIIEEVLKDYIGNELVEVRELKLDKNFFNKTSKETEQDLKYFDFYKKDGNNSNNNP